MNLQRFFLNSIVASDLFDMRDRLSMYRRFGLQATDAYIQSGVFFTRTDLSTIVMGDRTFINHRCYIDNSERIIIEDDVCIADNVMLRTTTHDVGESDRRVGHTCRKAPIRIGRGSWLCGGCQVLPGVTIGEGCVIAAGAIVTKDCEPDWLYAGVPAKRIKKYEVLEGGEGRSPLHLKQPVDQTVQRQNSISQSNSARN